MNAPKRPIAALEAQARHLLLMIGLGFAAVASGALLTVALDARIHDRVLSSGNGLVSFVVGTLIGGLWCLAVLPTLIYLACRYLDLRPIATAVTSGVTGEVFVLAVQLAGRGTDGVLGDPMGLATQLTIVGCGIAFSAWAARQGRAWAARSEAAAIEQAKQRKGQYDEFLKQSAAFAEEREAKKSSAGEGTAPAAEPAAPAEAPAQPVAEPPPAADAPAPAPGAGDLAKSETKS